MTEQKLLLENYETQEQRLIWFVRTYRKFFRISSRLGPITFPQMMADFAWVIAGKVTIHYLIVPPEEFRR